jgi:Double zinc ribbon
MTSGTMTDSAPTPAPVACPACGAAAEGRFCPSCGASLTPRACPRCATALRATAKFCHRCGAAADGRSAPAPAGAPAVSPSRTPWLVAGLLTIAVLSFITYKGINKNNPPAAPLMPNAGNADGTGQVPPFAGGAAGAGGAAQDHHPPGAVTL